MNGAIKLGYGQLQIIRFARISALGVEKVDEKGVIVSGHQCIGNFLKEGTKVHQNMYIVYKTD